MDFIWIVFAYACGLGVKVFSLPPLVGYLFAGFVLHGLGFQPADELETLADLGITLMLFTIGLKLKVGDLLKSEVWGGTFSNMSLWLVLVGSLFVVLWISGISLFSELNLTAASIIVFALSFSSTVCIFKILEENGELRTRHGSVAIGVLIMQDIIAVVFLVVATGVMPSVWSPLLLLLLFSKPVLSYLLEKSGHGELLILTGFFLALGAHELFYAFNIKGDLGALLIGVLMAGHPKTNELYKALMGFKDLFLIGFFLSIGFTALPDAQMLSFAALFLLFLPIKQGLFFFAFVKTHLRARTAFLSSLVLTNYSEFGLIVIALAVEAGWVGKEWLVILALALSFSFVLTSMSYRKVHYFYARWKDRIKPFESTSWLKADMVYQPIGAEVLVIGMGRVGKGAFRALSEINPEKVWGMDADSDRVELLKGEGALVFAGDGEDAELWQNFDTSKIKLVLLALPSINDIKQVNDQLRSVDFQGKVAAIARFEDQREFLELAGIDKIFNFYTEAGVGFAEESMALIKSSAIHGSD